MGKPKIKLLATNGEHLAIAYHYLKDITDIQAIIVEPPMSKKKMLQYRIKRLGLFSVFGQVLFILFSKIISRFSNSRKKQLEEQYNLSFAPVPSELITNVSSVNSAACRKALKRGKFDFVFVVGTRIIGKKTLQSISAPFVNSHAGITPKYRGVHGGYWALVNQDKNNCGVTLHYVDTGVDTGDIIAQANISPSKNDTFFTYPILQQYLGLELLKDNFEFILAGKAGTNRTDLESEQWFHPTIWTYFYHWITKGIN